MLLTALRMAARSRIAQCAVIVHLVIVALALSQMGRYEDLGCTEAVRHSVLDRPVAGRRFYFHHSSALTQAVVLIDLPSLSIADLSVALCERAVGGWAGATRSRATTLSYALATTLQWVVLGALGSTAVRRRQQRTSDRSAAPPN